MEIAPTYLVLADVGGYTRFIRDHRMSLAHAEAIITRLLESVIDQAAYPITLNKLEGDAALFYARAPHAPEASHDILRQTTRFFEAFDATQRELIAGTVCTCNACQTVGRLNLKAILHHGAVGFKQVRRFEELAGEPVILAHRLLKNTIGRKRYVLMTAAFAQGIELGGLGTVESRLETADDFGAVPVAVLYPGGAEAVAPAPALGSAPWWKKLGQLLLIQRHLILRLLKLRKAVPLTGLAEA
ncbi:MAG: DUF2652 domain-containing protein [Candidatus Lambdaproteobacteria bacterium]|nr:DUF2652 domain-containing protein [Candidatus Lambdaproteobacteria bacterium]